MSCSIANAHYALLKAIFPHFDICVDSHKDILCLCDIWTCSLYWKMDSNSHDQCFFLGVFQSSALQILLILSSFVFPCFSFWECKTNQHSKTSAKVSLVPCTCWENPAIHPLYLSVCSRGEYGSTSQYVRDLHAQLPAWELRLGCLTQLVSVSWHALLIANHWWTMSWPGGEGCGGKWVVGRMGWCKKGFKLLKLAMAMFSSWVVGCSFKDATVYFGDVEVVWVCGIFVWKVLHSFL